MGGSYETAFTPLPSTEHSRLLLRGPELLAVVGLLIAASGVYVAIADTALAGSPLVALGTVTLIFSVVLARASGHTKLQLGISSVETDVFNPDAAPQPSVPCSSERDGPHAPG
jgi:hypothetical protein